MEQVVAQSPDVEPVWVRTAVSSVIVGVGLYDVAIGAYMLWSATPQAAHGAGTVWQAMRLDDPGVAASLRRIGAFSLHAGVVSCVWAAMAWGRPQLRSWLFLTYLATGLAFYWTDQRFFAGTTYALIKQWIGNVFTAAMLLHFWQRYRSRRAA